MSLRGFSVLAFQLSYYSQSVRLPLWLAGRSLHAPQCARNPASVGRIWTLEQRSDAANVRGEQVARHHGYTEVVGELSVKVCGKLRGGYKSTWSPQKARLLKMAAGLMTNIGPEKANGGFGGDAFEFKAAPQVPDMRYWVRIADVWLCCNPL